MKRLTLNYGARFEHFNASVPAESSPASTWIGARNFPAIPDVPNWNDWAVRLAAAYDLFGNGKTAIKGNAGKYVAAQAAGFAQTFNGMSGATQTVTWTDLDRNGTILDAAGNIQVNEVGARTSNFGQITSPSGSGAGARLQLGVQRGLAARAHAAHLGHAPASITAISTTSRSYDNQNLAASDWTALSIATPTDPRLPLSGQPIPLYTLNPAKVGVGDRQPVYLFDARTRRPTTGSRSRPICAATSSSSLAA